MTQGIYSITEKHTNKIYYGSSTNIEKRWRQHQSALRNNRHHNMYMQRLYNLYGEDLFVYCIVQETTCITSKELLLLEQKYIDSNPEGLNLGRAGGGDMLSNHPNRDEIIRERNITCANKLKMLTKEERVLKYANTGSSNGRWKGGPASPDTISHKLCPVCLESVILTKSSVCGKCRDRTGKNNPFYGKRHSESTKQKIKDRKAGKKSWIQGINPAELPYTRYYELTYPDGHKETFAGLKAISNILNVSTTYVHTLIKRCKDGKLPKSGKCANFIVVDVTDAF